MEALSEQILQCPGKQIRELFQNCETEEAFRQDLGNNHKSFQRGLPQRKRRSEEQRKIAIDYEPQRGPTSQPKISKSSSFYFHLEAPLESPKRS